LCPRSAPRVRRSSSNALRALAQGCAQSTLFCTFVNYNHGLTSPSLSGSQTVFWKRTLRCPRAEASRLPLQGCRGPLRCSSPSSRQSSTERGRGGAFVFSVTDSGGQAPSGLVNVGGNCLNFQLSVSANKLSWTWYHLKNGFEMIDRLNAETFDCKHFCANVRLHQPRPSGPCRPCVTESPEQTSD